MTVVSKRPDLVSLVGANDHRGEVEGPTGKLQIISEEMGEEYSKVQEGGQRGYELLRSYGKGEVGVRTPIEEERLEAHSDHRGKTIFHMIHKKGQSRGAEFAWLKKTII